MIEWLKIWVNQIIIAVIIAVVFELILPNGKNKKYIKMIINLYVLFAILNPIISKITNQKFSNLNEFDYSQYFSNTTQASSTVDTNYIIESTYEKSLKEDIQKKLQSEGYKASSISININKDKNDEKYGSITKITIAIQDNKEKENSNITIEDVTISSNSTSSSKEKIRKTDSNKIKKFIAEEYQINQEDIEVY